MSLSAVRYCIEAMFSRQIAEVGVPVTRRTDLPCSRHGMSATGDMNVA